MLTDVDPVFDHVSQILVLFFRLFYMYKLLYRKLKMVLAQRITQKKRERHKVT